MQDSSDRGLKRFFLRALGLGAAVVFTGVLLSGYDTSATDNSYLAAVLEKDRLIRGTPSPKIVLVGGSNLAFGVDSRMLRDSLGLSVVNMGLYSKLGLRYMLAQAKPYVRRGDVVVVSPEYEQFYGDFADGDHTLNSALLYTPRDRVPDLVESYSVVDVVLRPRVEQARRSFLQGLADLAGMKDRYFPADTNVVYNRRSFNELGDMVGHLNRAGPNPDSIYAGAIGTTKPFNTAIIDMLDDIAGHARDRGAQAYFLFPSYMDRAFALRAEAIDTLRATLSSRTSIPIVGTARDFVYPTSYFYDTRYHLTVEGRQIRTARMIQLLREARGRDGW